MYMRIDGKDCASSDNEWIEIKNPATGEIIDRVPGSTAADVDVAVQAAATASDAWKKKTQRERGVLLYRAADEVRRHIGELARVLTTEQGKPLKESTDEVRGLANILEFYAGIAAKPAGDVIRLGAAGDCMVVREPVGVCGAIIPWNMPVIILGWKAAPALLAGNTLLVKPSSTTPLSCLHLAALMEKAGLPPGVLNIVTGSGESVGTAIVKHPAIKKVSFTGERTTGHAIGEMAAGLFKEITLELGGSDPMIVMDDADVQKAAAGALRGRFYNAGQTCTAVKRLYVHEKVAESFLRHLKKGAEALRVGNGLDPATDIGPLNNNLARTRIADAVSAAVEMGEGTAIAGGSLLQGKGYGQGYFYPPTVMTDIVPGTRLVTEEIFGPVLPVMAVPDLDMAIEQANATQYGLGASVWTRDLATVKRVFEEVNAGVIWVNRHLTVPPEIPFGGMKESGMGRENGFEALNSYTRTKTLFLGW
jgi:succinate-semialdehyde dehydrogenase/glutarate-semialdehyde dehydrogenase